MSSRPPWGGVAVMWSPSPRSADMRARRHREAEGRARVCPIRDRAAVVPPSLPGGDAEQVLELLAHGAVALARGRLQAGPVEQGHAAVHVADDARLLQDGGRNRDAGAARA